MHLSSQNPQMLTTLILSCASSVAFTYVLSNDISNRTKFNREFKTTGHFNGNQKVVGYITDPEHDDFVKEMTEKSL